MDQVLLKWTRKLHGDNFKLMQYMRLSYWKATEFTTTTTMRTLVVTIEHHSLSKLIFWNNSNMWWVHLKFKLAPQNYRRTEQAIDRSPKWTSDNLHWPWLWFAARGQSHCHSRQKWPIGSDRSPKVAQLPGGSNMIQRSTKSASVNEKDLAPMLQVLWHWSHSVTLFIASSPTLIICSDFAG